MSIQRGSTKVWVCFLWVLAFQGVGYSRVFFVTDSLDDAGRHTLRAAIMDANKSHGYNTIVLPLNDYQLTAHGYGDQLEISAGNLTIIGMGRPVARHAVSSSVTVNSVYMTRFFHVLPGARLTLQNLVLTGGGNAAEESGAIKNEGSLDLENCAIQNNSAYLGAGIYNAGSLTMGNVIVSGNSCYGWQGGGGGGGGIYNEGTLAASNCVISNNISGSGAWGDYFLGYGDGIIEIFNVGNLVLPSYPGYNAGNGGGIFNSGTMTLNHCFILANFTGQGGDASIGVGVSGADGGMGGNGAGIFNQGSLTINHCVISGNKCGSGGSGAVAGSGFDGGNGGSGGFGGGVFNVSGAIVKSFNSLVFNNDAGFGGADGPGVPGYITYLNYATVGVYGNPGVAGSGSDLFGNFNSSGYNLIRLSDDSTGFTNGIKNDVVGSLIAPANPGLFQLK